MIAYGVEAYRNISIDDPLVPRMLSEGYSRDFAEGIARLFIHRYEHREITTSCVKNAIRSVRQFSKAVKLHYDGEVAHLSIDGISLEAFLHFRGHISGLDHIETTKSGMFIAVKQLFSHPSVENQKAISMLKYLRSTGGIKKPAKDLTAPLAETTKYNDAVMFQLFSHFIVDFERHIKLLKEYEAITKQAVQELCCGNVAVLPSTTTNRNKTSRKNTTLISSWLEKEASYPILVAHELWWWKEWKVDFYHTRVRWSCNKDEYLKPLVRRYGLPRVC